MASLRYNLNRLLDGTHGVDIDQPKTWLDEAGAANALAGTTGLDTVGALNQYAASGRSPVAYGGLVGVLNELAGTSGLGLEGAADAL
jgi:hypothetical protein